MDTCIMVFMETCNMVSMEFWRGGAAPQLTDYYSPLRYRGLKTTQDPKSPKGIGSDSHSS